ncbi:condensation domain-containing protein [Corallococcus terminator]
MHPDIWRAFQRLRTLRSEAPPLVPREHIEDPPASFQQERLWYLDQASPGGTAYHLPVAFRISGPLDWRALRLSLEALEHRHEALRTSFDSSRGKVIQRVRAPGAFVLPTISLRDEAQQHGQQEARLREALHREAWRPFDLHRDALFRATLFVLDAREHVLLLNFHHIIYDGWSQDVLFRDLSELYTAFHEGGLSPLPELDVCCRDHARWQRKWLQGSSREELQAYWREHLKERLQGPRLASRARTGNVATPGLRELGRLPITLSPEVSKALLQFTREAGATAYMVLLAAFHVLLHRHSGGQEQHFVCSPIANRPQAQTERLIGYFVNLLVLPADLRGDPSFLQLLEQVRGVVAGALAHQDLPVQFLDGVNLGGEALSQALFAFENTPRYPLQLTKLDVTPVELDGGTCDFDLFLALHEEQGVISGTLKFSRQRFDADEAARLLRDFETILGQAVAAPGQALSAFVPDLVVPRDAPSPRPLTPEPSRAPSAGPSASSTEVLAALGTARPEQRRALMRDYLRSTVIRVALRGQTPDVPFQSLQELALDSLRLIELTGRIRTELSIDMPVSHFFEATSVEVLADELLTRWLRAQLSETRAPAAGGRRELLTL